MVTNFTSFAPLGTVFVAMLGIGVAEHSGFITTGIRALLNVTAKWLLTPMVILVGIMSHSAVDAGYVLDADVAIRPATAPASGGEGKEVLS